MIEELNRWLTVAMIVIPAVVIVSIVAGWVRDARERRRVERIMRGE